MATVTAFIMGSTKRWSRVTFPGAHVEIGSSGELVVRVEDAGTVLTVHVYPHGQWRYAREDLA